MMVPTSKNSALCGLMSDACEMDSMKKQTCCIRSSTVGAVKSRITLRNQFIRMSYSRIAAIFSDLIALYSAFSHDRYSLMSDDSSMCFLSQPPSRIEFGGVIYIKLGQIEGSSRRFVP